MSQYVVNSFNELHDVLTSYRNDTVWVYRGHSDSSWNLIPKAGRLPFSASDDRGIIQTWKRRAIEYNRIEPKDDWDWLAIAQHHGLATRLLDWTMNPLVAAFFAVFPEDEHEAIIYAYRSSRVVIQERVSPWDCEGVVKFRPRGIAKRIVRQDGLFTIHNPPTLGIEECLQKPDVLNKIIVSQSYRRQLLYELFQYGISMLSLFPDLDGLSAHVNWYMSNLEYFNKA